MEQPTAILNLDDLRERKLVLADQRKVHEEKLARLALEDTGLAAWDSGSEQKTVRFWSNVGITVPAGAVALSTQPPRYRPPG